MVAHTEINQHETSRYFKKINHEAHLIVLLRVIASNLKQLRMAI